MSDETEKVLNFSENAFSKLVNEGFKFCFRTYWGGVGIEARGTENDPAKLQFKTDYEQFR